MSRRPIRTRRPSRPRRPARPTIDTAPLLRLVLGVTAFALFVALVPPLRAFASAVGGTLNEAMLASRASEIRRVAAGSYAMRYDVPFDLAFAIYRAAEEEGLDPELGFRLVAIESEFHERAVSPAGALGLTQLMPATAAELRPGITREETFDRDTNLHLGFRYLRTMIRVNEGGVAEALHAYNRGPGTVARIRASGGDPANGYAIRVLGRGASAYLGDGLVDP